MHCKIHPQLQAVQMCSTCGGGLCSQCEAAWRPARCVECLIQQSRKMKRNMVIVGVVSGIVGLIVAAAYVKSSGPIAALLGGALNAYLVASLAYGWGTVTRLWPRGFFIFGGLLFWAIALSVLWELAIIVGIVAMPLKVRSNLKRIKEVEMVAAALKPDVNQYLPASSPLLSR
jgi:hypothetical protein